MIIVEFEIVVLRFYSINIIGCILKVKDLRNHINAIINKDIV